jgi:hypothetical protein
MPEKTIALKIEFRRSQMLYMLAFFFVCLSAKNLSPESVTLTTYYPAPAGAYNNMVTIGNTWLARDPVSGGGESYLEIGGNQAVTNTNTKLAVMSNNGNPLVGINTTDPTLGGVVGSIFTINAPGGTGLTIANNGTPAFALNPESNGAWQMFDYAAGSWNSELSGADGNIGINTGSPQAKLDVEGGQITVGPWTSSHGGNSYIHINGQNCQLWGPGANSCHGGGQGADNCTCPGGSYATWTPGIYVEGNWYHTRYEWGIWGYSQSNGWQYYSAGGQGNDVSIQAALPGWSNWASVLVPGRNYLSSNGNQFFYCCWK